MITCMTQGTHACNHFLDRDLFKVYRNLGVCTFLAAHQSCIEYVFSCCLQKLKVLDVTMGTSVSLADGFRISPEQGVWNVPAGAVLYAPHVAVSSLSMTTDNNNTAFA